MSAPCPSSAVAWPWYCAIGVVVTVAVSWAASLILDGPQKEYSPYSVRGQIAKYRREGLAEKDGGWFVVPGRVDKISYLLLVFFALTLLFVFGFERLI